MSIAIGDRVKVVKPDPSSGASCILAGYDAAYLVVLAGFDSARLDLVKDGHANTLFIETRIGGMPDPVLVRADEVVKVDDRPWWEGK